MSYAVILLDPPAPQSSPMAGPISGLIQLVILPAYPDCCPDKPKAGRQKPQSLCHPNSSFPSLPLVYIPKKAASKARAPRRRQRKTQRPPVPEAPKEVPPEAVKEYADIMEGLVGSQLAIGEADGKQEEEEEQQQQEEAMYPDPGLLSYIDELCSQEVFVSKVGWTWVSGF